MSDFQKLDIKKSLTDYLPARAILILTALFVVFGILLGSILSLTVFHFEGSSLEEILKISPSDLSLNQRNLMRLVTFINQAFTFLIPALALVYLIAKKQWTHYLNLNKSPKPLNISLAIILILSAFPLTQFVFWLNKQIPLPELFQQWENSSETAINGLVIMESPLEFLISFSVMAITPALGEEFIFRGIIQKNFAKLFNNGHLAVWMAAFIFSAFHFQFMGFLPRFFLGVLLGYLLLWTRNLWIPIIAHLIYNGVQVFAAYRLGGNLDRLNTQTDELMPIGIIIFSFIFVATSLYAIKKINRIEISETEQNENQETH